MREFFEAIFTWLASRDCKEDEDAKEEERRAKGAGIPRRDFWDNETDNVTDNVTGDETPEQTGT